MCNSICGNFSLLPVSDTAYTSLAIDSHTDGNYFTEAPGIISFCVYERSHNRLSVHLDSVNAGQSSRQGNLTP